MTGLTREYSGRFPAWEQQGDSQQAADGQTVAVRVQQGVSQQVADGGSQRQGGSQQAAARGSWLLPRCTLATTACRLLAASLLHPGRRRDDSQRIRVGYLNFAKAVAIRF